MNISAPCAEQAHPDRQQSLQRLLREPLLHFLLLGCLLFGVHALLADATGEAPTIVVSQGRIDALEATFAKAWRRGPTAEELDGLVSDYVREEVAVREARAMGIDAADAVIRRLLRQKLEFVTTDLASRAEPSEAQLRDYLQAHPEAFRQPARYSFIQVFLDPGRRGERLQADARRLLARLNSIGGEVDSSQLGDRSLLEPGFTELSGDDIDRQFGDGFSQLLAEQPQGRWFGPLPSAYGMHLVYVQQVHLGVMADFAVARDQLRHAWQLDQRQQQLDQFYALLLQRYAVVVDAKQTP
jgi:hypothetical protein